jgi:hypothetical protein
MLETMVVKVMFQSSNSWPMVLLITRIKRVQQMEGQRQAGSLKDSDHTYFLGRGHSLTWLTT